MTERRIPFNNIVQNQLPTYVRDEFPLVAEFLKQYYISQEFTGASTDLIQNIDNYIKLDTIKNQAEDAILAEDISFSDDVIVVSTQSGTQGFPDSYGLLQIDSEIITYTGKTSNSFTGCVRGFSGIISNKSENRPDELVFSRTESVEHLAGTKITNLSSLFLSEFFTKIKYQIAPGFENREFYSGTDKYLFLKQSKDFYSTRGTEASFKILFKILYGEDVKVIKPQDYLTKPSDSNYVVTNDMVVEVIEGDPYKLENATLFQDDYPDIPNISLAYVPIYKVEKIFSDSTEEYYKLSFDAGYNRDLGVNGTLYGDFVAHPRTKLIGQVTSGSTTLDVDSTVGFPLSGSLDITYSNGVSDTITYTSKSINQFFGCSNISSSILDGSDINLSVYARNEDGSVKVRITSVLNEVDILDDTYYYSKGETGIIKTLGVNPKDNISNNWVFNTLTTHEVFSIEIVDFNNRVYKITTNYNNNLVVGDSISIISNNGEKIDSEVTGIVSGREFITQVLGTLDVSIPYTVRRNILKVNYPNYPNTSNIIANIQNVYKEKDNKTLVASSSIPHYSSPLATSTRTKKFSGTFSASPTNPLDTFNIGTHYFYTGDLVYYTPGTNQLFEEGLYFVKRVSSTTIKLAKSRSNIYESIFVEIVDTIQSNDNTLVEYEIYQKTLESQKLLREIAPPVDDGFEYVTEPGPIGIFINGTELLNYKSRDKIYYGPIETIEVSSSGEGYDVINPPVLSIEDPSGSGAAGYCSVNGSLQEIRIIDPGFDYLEEPKVNITGGNGSGAIAKAKTKLVDHKVFFNSQSTFGLVDLSNNTIAFSTYHKFRDAESVIYRTEGQDGVGGISTNSIYYVSVQGPQSVKLHTSYVDAVSRVNDISLTSYGTGNHILEATNKKAVIASVNIEENGTGYENKKRTANPLDVSRSYGRIKIRNHGFNSGEIVKYTSTENVIGGLNDSETYYVTKVDEDNFKLSYISSEIDNEDFYYKTKQYVKLTSVGSGIHIFNYPEISVDIIGRVGVSSISGKTFNATVQPIFRGEVTSVHLEKSGVGYGSSEILNFEREPLVNLTTGTGAKLTPIINDGKIIEVLIEDPGVGYNCPPDLVISTEEGNGVGAVLTPIVENGQIVSVNIIESGIDYDKYKTSILVISPANGAKFKSIIKTWNVNLFERYSNNITDDDGFIFYNPLSNYGLQYTHLYTPRKLRESVYSRELGDNILYGKYDLPKLNSVEVSSDAHSPIIGWAYDGNPIYGPYGYSRKDGGQITQIRSGYRLNPKSNRPPFPLGFFVEDYEHLDVDDDTILDKHNGRFCVTPDFPNGTYAYFTTIEPSADRTKFGGYRLPEFPYVIGSTYKSVPNKFNFSGASNQDTIDLNETKWARNTSLYNLTAKEKSYTYIPLPNKLNQTVDVKYASPGVVDNILINFGGKNYKVNDRIVFNDAETGGYGLTSKVSRISGKPVNNISFASTVLYYNNELYATQGSPNSFTVQSDSPYDLKNGQIVSISGLSTTNIVPQGFYVVSGIVTNTFAISDPNGINESSSTGIVTYLPVSGNIAYSNVRENDIYQIGEEKVKVLSVDRESSRLKIMREIDGTVGTSHSYSDILYELPRRFTVRTGISTTFNFKLNKEIYFDPSESLGIGSISGVGIGSTLVFGNPGVGLTQIFIPTKTVYLPNHNLETGDSVIYSTNGGSGILVSSVGIGTTFLTNNSRLYVAKITNDLIGISTVKVGINSTGTISGIAGTNSSITTLYLIEPGQGNNHSFKTEYPTLNAQLTRSTVTVSTASTHGLSDGDDVFISINSGISTTVIVKYDDFNRKLLINPRSFTPDDVDLETNTITIVDHKLKTGQKVSFASTDSFGDLENNGIYYAVVYNKDRIKLAPSYHDATKLVPNLIGIGSESVGTISPINPPIKGYKNSSIIFDVSDESLSFLSGSSKFSAFKLNFYLDSNFTQIFDTSKTSDVFEVKRSGKLGIDSNARVSLNINDNVPTKLFYKLDPVYNANLPTEKSEINIDDSVSSYNQIEIISSFYNGNYKVRVPSPSTFTYDLIGIPEYDQYNSSNSTISYETTSASALGPISKIDLQSKGQNYYSLPKFSRVISNLGSGAILQVESNSIGKIRKTVINDIGFDFPSDYTLRPNLSLPQIAILEPLNSIDSIGITSVGRGYNTPPKLVVIDGKTNKQIEDVDLRYSLGDSQVTILKNTYSLNDIEPIIIPTQNPNGVGIGSISYDENSKTVTVSMSVGFSTANTFPFSVGDRVLIENINVGIGTSVVGYNSKDYDYQLFTLTSVDPNIGGIGTVGYSLDGYLNEGDTPGIFDPDFSSGRIIPEKHFPIFKTNLRQNNFFIGEKVRYLGEKEPVGIVEGWDRKSYNLKISSREIIENRELEGVSSKTQGLISSTKKFDGFINHGAYSKVEKGSEFETGILNNTLQRIQDNFYYQNFSYSLKSRVSYDIWEDVVGSLNHTAGFKKFSDYQLESSEYCGISTDSIGDLESFTDVDSVVNLNCVYDFDLVRENSITLDSSYFSDNVSYKNKILADYFELVGNRVLSIDDISDRFSSDPRFDLFVEVDRFRLADIRSKKYIFYIRDRRFYSEKQVIIVTLIHDGLDVYLNQYGRVESYLDLGSFDFRVEGDEGVVLFYPTKNRVNDYNITQLSYNIEDSFSGLGNTSLGGIVNIESESVAISTGSTTTIVSLGSSFTSSKLLVSLNSDDGRYQFDELSVVQNGSEVYIGEYGQLVSGELGYTSTVGFGTYNAYLSGSDLKVDFIPDTDVSATANVLKVSFSNDVSSGVSTVFMKYAGLKATATSIAPTLSPTPIVVSEHPTGYYGAYYIAQISNIGSNEHEILEIITLDDQFSLYEIGYGVVQTNSGLGTFGITKSGGITRLNFTPEPNSEIEVKVFSNYLTDSTDEAEEPTDFNEKMFRTGGSIYYGIENELNNSFELNHKDFPIFKKDFDGSSLESVDILNNTITLPNHFFVTGEELYYSFGDFNLGDRPINISPTDFGVGIGITNTLPSKVYAITLDQNRIRLAKSSEDALSGIPIPVTITDIGSGTFHSFSAVNQNSKCLIAIDNIIQSPVVSTAVTTKLSETLPITENILFVDNEKLFSTGELIIIDNEISRVRGVGIGSTNTLLVTRSVLGTNIGVHSAGKVVSKLSGNYNIVGNTVHFASPPYGNVPYSSDSNPPNERDWIGIATNSTFQGRVFLRNAATDSLEETYSKNYVFDDISPQFTGSQKFFNLTSNDSNISDIYNQNAIILVNDIFQEPGQARSYTLGEGTVGITSITFVGTATSTLSDINTSGLPRGGVIVSVGSTEGLGYQPLISAGGTAVVSSAGTIASISIGNSGSGYRSAVQTPDGIKPVTVNVGIQTSSTDTPNIQFIGTATVTNGNITSVSIANTEVFYVPRLISDLQYDNTSGLTTVFTSTPHGLYKGDVITLTGIAMTCDYAPPINVLDAVYDHTTGITTITTSTPHGLSITGENGLSVSGNKVILSGLGFTCNDDGGATVHYYPRPSDPGYCGVDIISIDSPTTFTVGVGTHTTEHFYTSGGTIQSAVTFPRDSDPIKENGGIVVTNIISDIEFEINSGISTRKHFYSRCGNVEKVFDVVFDSPISYSSLPLVYSSPSSGNGVQATIDIVVGQGSSVIDFEIKNLGYNYAIGDTLTVDVGGITGIPTVYGSTFKNFEISVQQTFTDKFNGWSIGELQVFDKIDKFFNNKRTLFSLKYEDNPISLYAKKGSPISVQDTLIVFLNEILQVPGESYIFNGGNKIEFTEPPKEGDSCKILFYKGTGEGVDVIFTDAFETIKTGDDIILTYDSYLNQSPSLLENPRTVSEVLPSDTKTNPYFGPGNTEDENLYRPINWCRQTDDKIIDGQFVAKDRDLYEPAIIPTANLIANLGIGDTTVYVDNLRPFFDQKNESQISLEFQKNITFVSKDILVSASATAVVSSAGTISAIVVNDGGFGYESSPKVYIQAPPTGISTITSTAVSSVISGEVTSISIVGIVSGYNQENPPVVLIEPPTPKIEKNRTQNYEGDFGVIVGLGVTLLGSYNQIVMDLYIPQESPLKDSNLVGVPIVQSSLDYGDYFVVYDSNTNVGSAITSFISVGLNNNNISSNTQQIDNIYQVSYAETIVKDIPGVGPSFVRRVYSRISGIGSTNFSRENITFDSNILTFDNIDISTDENIGIISTTNYFGNYSWGKIALRTRTKALEYSPVVSIASSISSSVVVTRQSPLKSSNYVI